jgi:hypothetical protein
VEDLKSWQKCVGVDEMFCTLNIKDQWFWKFGHGEAYSVKKNIFLEFTLGEK